MARPPSVRRDSSIRSLAGAMTMNGTRRSQLAVATATRIASGLTWIAPSERRRRDTGKHRQEYSGATGQGADHRGTSAAIRAGRKVPGSRNRGTSEPRKTAGLGQDETDRAGLLEEEGIHRPEATTGMDGRAPSRPPIDAGRGATNASVAHQARNRSSPSSSMSGRI
jgi:hypothetical protein